MSSGEGLMAERREAAQGGISGARSAVTTRGVDTSDMEDTMELPSGGSGDAVPRKSTPCYAAPAGEGTQAPVLDFGIFSPACPSRTMLYHVTDHRTPLVVTVLTSEPGRFRGLRARVDGVTPEVLTQTLRFMERDGLVMRTQPSGVPPRVDYELTDLGRSLQAPIDTLCTQIHAHSTQIPARRKFYDTVES